MRMTKTISYYMTSISPWTYFGGKLVPEIAAKADATLDIRPCKLADVFAVTGGLPLGQRSQARQDYRLVEMARWRDHHGLSDKMNIEPPFFPTIPAQADCLIIAAKQAGHDVIALSNAVMACVWERDLNIAEPDTLGTVCRELGLDNDALLAAAEGDAVLAEYDANTQQAIADGVFGAPWYIYDGIPYWGQDRVQLLELTLNKG